MKWIISKIRSELKDIDKLKEVDKLEQNLINSNDRVTSEQELMNIFLDLFPNNEDVITIKTNDWNIFDLILHNNKPRIFTDHNGKKQYAEISAGFHFNQGEVSSVLFDVVRGSDNRSKDTIFPHPLYSIDHLQFILHTHPFKSKQINRIEQGGQLFEFPSSHDLLHFNNHQINFTSKGIKSISFVLTLEGVYSIQIRDYSKIKDCAFNNLNMTNEEEDIFHKKYLNTFSSVYQTYFKKYGQQINNANFYKDKLRFFYKIIQNSDILHDINLFLEPYNLIIGLHKRVVQTNYRGTEDDYNIENSEEPTDEGVEARFAAKAIFDLRGYNKDGFDKYGYDQYGYNKDGFNAEGYDKTGHNAKKEYMKEYDWDNSNANVRRKIYDKYGYNRLGYDQYGWNAQGYDIYGWNAEGWNKEGWNKEGYNRKGFDIFGKTKDGRDMSDFNLLGYDQQGYDTQGYDKQGYDKDGFDFWKYDKQGFNKDGLNILGQTKEEAEKEQEPKSKLPQIYIEQKPQQHDWNDLSSSDDGDNKDITEIEKNMINIKQTKKNILNVNINGIKQYYDDNPKDNDIWLIPDFHVLLQYHPMEDDQSNKKQVDYATVPVIEDESEDELIEQNK